MDCTIGFNGSTNLSNLSLSGQQKDFTYYFEMVFCLTVAPITSVLNSLIIGALSKKGHSPATTGFNTFAIALGLTDLLVGAVVLPIHTHLALLERSPLGPVGCAIWKTVDYGLTSVSVFLMVAMGADRSKCVTSPLVYRMKFTRKRAVLISVGLWILGFAVWIPIILMTFIKYGHIGEETNCILSRVGTLVIPQIVVAYFIPILAMMVVNARLALTVRRRSARDLSEIPRFSFKANRREIGINNTNKEDRNENGNNGSNTVDKKGRLVTISYQNKQCIKISVIIVITFLICWTPYALLYPVRVLNASLISLKTYDMFGFVTYLNSAITPVVYIVTSEKLRNDVKDLFSRRKPSSSHVEMYAVENWRN